MVYMYTLDSNGKGLKNLTATPCGLANLAAATNPLLASSPLNLWQVVEGSTGRIFQATLTFPPSLSLATPGAATLHLLLTAKCDGLCYPEVEFQPLETVYPALVIEITRSASGLDTSRHLSVLLVVVLVTLLLLSGALGFGKLRAKFLAFLSPTRTYIRILEREDQDLAAIRIGQLQRLHEPANYALVPMKYEQASLEARTQG